MRPAQAGPWRALPSAPALRARGPGPPPPGRRPSPWRPLRGRLPLSAGSARPHGSAALSGGFRTGPASAPPPPPPPKRRGKKETPPHTRTQRSRVLPLQRQQCCPARCFRLLRQPRSLPGALTTERRESGLEEEEEESGLSMCPLAWSRGARTGARREGGLIPSCPVPQRKQPTFLQQVA